MGFFRLFEDFFGDYQRLVEPGDLGFFRRFEDFFGDYQRLVEPGSTIDAVGTTFLSQMRQSWFL